MPSEDLLFSSVEPSPSFHGSGMSDERNADSVLFQLETVAQMQAAQRQKRASQSSLLVARLAAPAPASKAGSGLIDIKTLASAEASSHDSSSCSVSDGALVSSNSMLGYTSSSEDDDVVVRGEGTSRTPLLVLGVLVLLTLVAVVLAIVLRGL